MNQKSRGDSMSKPVMKMVKGDGININLAIWEGKDPPILCVHGITANCRCWDVVADLLAPQFRVLSVDLRGRGRSDKPSEGYSIDHHTNDINNLLDDMGIDQIILMGHSLGAFISLVFAAKYPERTQRLVLIDGGGDLSPEQIGEVFKGIKPALDRLGQLFPSPEVYIDKLKASPYFRPWSEAIETYCRYELEEVEGGVRTNINPLHIVEESSSARLLHCADYYPLIRCPVLILRATEGMLSSKSMLLPEDVIVKMQRAMPTAERFDVEGLNHYGIIFQPHSGRDKALMDFLEIEAVS
jgi:pimeloyl-ACP methyl ester carboxylesterase